VTRYPIGKIQKSAAARAPAIARLAGWTRDHCVSFSDLRRWARA
jgi:hypothetical protein